LDAQPDWSERPSASVSHPERVVTDWSVDLPSTAHAPGLARRAVEPLAARLDTEPMENARLLVSELVTNAVLHAGPGASTIHVHVEVLPDVVVVSVTDAGRGFDPGGLAGSRSGEPGGRGLELVSALADDIGIDGRDPFRVWFSLRL
jgi:anti-sigma regulatory factor (Ser/Thr protein kinase)